MTSSYLRREQTPSTCLYGDEDRRDRVLFEYHAFSLIVSFSLSFLLMGNEKLRKVYTPLYHIVNCALFLQICSDLLFFSYYPYSETTGNCTEVFVRRLYVLFIMFGELHQVYFIANVLGLSRFRFRFPCLIFYSSVTLQTFLQAATLTIALTLMGAVFVKGIFMIDQDLWSLFIVGLQLYFIRNARYSNTTEAVVDANNEAVNIFATLSWLQIIPTLVALTDRICHMNGIHFYRDLDGVMLILECLNEYLFYIKILVLHEKASAVSVEIFEEK